VSVRTIVIVLLALVCGLSASYGILSMHTPAASQAAETVPVLVAAVDIPSFAVLSADMVKTRDVPKDMLLEGAIAKVDDAVDRAVLSPVMKGEVLYGPKLSRKGTRGMSGKVPPGMRAFTINTPTVEQGVAGFVLPGNRVDILLTLTGATRKDPGGRGTTFTLLQNMEILAIEQRVDPPAESKVDLSQLRSVTLLVTPEQANKLQVGQSQGKLSLTLRNPTDTASVSTEPVYLSELLGELPREEPKPAPKLKPEPKRAALPPPAPPPLRIRTLRGTSEGFVLVQQDTKVGKSR
jgi:pilus assembly protein CpaB